MLPVTGVPLSEPNSNLITQERSAVAELARTRLRSLIRHLPFKEPNMLAERHTI